jgi:competence transcription factor ComK
MLGFKYKTPIIVSEINNIIFFPTIAPKETYCVWISQNNIEKYRREGNIPL